MSALLRCQVNRAAIAARSDDVSLLTVADMVTNADLALAVRTAAAWTLTSWEYQTLRTFAARYPQFAGLYGITEQFVNHPNQLMMAVRTVELATFLGGIALLRGVPDNCHFAIDVPGISPTDVAIRQKTMQRPPAPVDVRPRHTAFDGRHRLAYGMVGATAIAAIGIAIVAIADA